MNLKQRQVVIRKLKTNLLQGFLIDLNPILDPSDSNWKGLNRLNSHLRLELLTDFKIRISNTSTISGASFYFTIVYFNTRWNL